MAAILYPLYAVLYAGLLIYGIYVYRQTRAWSTVFLLAVTFGVFYDNLILSIGRLLGEGALLQNLSWPRFILHQVVLPLLIPAVFMQARRAARTWNRSQLFLHRFALPVVWAFTLLTIALGVATRLVGQTLEPELLDGVLRYSAMHVSGPPLVSLLSIGFAGLVGWFFWRRSGWPWLFWITLAVFVGEGLPVKGLRLVLGSGLELVFMWVAFQTERWSLRLERQGAGK